MRNLVGFMGGRVSCVDAFPDFATYDILFMVSREELSSGTAAISAYIRPVKKVWRSQNDLIDQVYIAIFSGGLALTEVRLHL